MGEKIRRGIQKHKTKIIVVLILWAILSIIFVGPLTMAINVHIEGGNLIKDFLDSISNPIAALGTSLTNHFELYLKTFLGFTLVYIIAISIGVFRAMPKTEYEDIEHGSSDWCLSGEQYKVLNPKEGILLAEKNYLPLDKIGNINVLVIRRFWCW